MAMKLSPEELKKAHGADFDAPSNMPMNMPMPIVGRRRPGAGRPKRLTEGRMFSFYLDLDSIDEIKRLAHQSNITTSEMARTLMNTALSELRMSAKKGSPDPDPEQPKKRPAPTISRVSDLRKVK